MPNYSSNRLETLYAQAQASGGLRAIINSAGTWTTTGTSRVRFTSFNAKCVNPVVDVPYKTGNSSQPIGVRGRSKATWSVSLPFIPSGAAGTAPDIDANIMKHIFGQLGTVVASTSVTYSLNDAIYPLSWFYYDKSGLSTPTNQYVLGACADTVKWSLNQQYLMMDLSGSAVYAPDSNNFASGYSGPDAIVKGGLTTYPAEPTLTNVGNPVTGFGATITFDGNVMADVRGALDITMSTGLEYAEDGVSDAYPFAVIRGLRRVVLSSFQIANDDTAALINLKQKAQSKAAIAASLAVTNGGTGSTITFNLNNVQLNEWSFQDNGTFVDVNLSQSLAHATAGNTDDFTIAIT